MLLTADVGNTETVLGVFDGADLAQTWRLSTQPERSADELALRLLRLCWSIGGSPSRSSRDCASLPSFPT